MTDNPTRAKMAILNLTPDEIIEAIRLLPRPSDWRELAAGAAGFKQDMMRIADAAIEHVGWVPLGGTLDINVAAYSYKCTPAQAADVARSIHKDMRQVLLNKVHARFKHTYGNRPHNPETMELIFDDNEIP